VERRKEGGAPALSAIMSATSDEVTEPNMAPSGPTFFLMKAPWSPKTAYTVGEGREALS